jgi:hypothetical protein
MSRTEHLANGDFYMGGYGIASGTAGVGPAKQKVLDGRAAVGTMGSTLANNPFAPSVRAFAVSDGAHTVVFTNLDNQGTFPQFKPNPNTGALRPYGIDDIRAEVAAKTGIDSAGIVISSDHSHAGQDMTGVWGFVPDSYLAFVKDQAVAAITEALSRDNLRPAILQQSSVATPQPCQTPDPPTRIFSNQFCGNEHLETVDADVRVLRAFPADDPAAGPFAILVNAAIHATVGGSDNLYVSSDWPSAVSNYLEDQYPGATAVTIVGDVGRTQPNDRNCTQAELAAMSFDYKGKTYTLDRDPRLDVTSGTNLQNDSCNISHFAHRVQAWVDAAVATEQPVASTGVAVDNMFIRDPSHSAILFGLNYAGDAAGAPIARSLTPPYLDGTVLGTWVGTFRIGDLLLLSAPGEAYPNIRDGVLEAVNSPGAKTWIFGLANDQLGYLIAPFPEGYPEPIRKSFFDGNPDDPTTWGISPIDNDNYFFNVSHTLGDHIMCTMIKGAGALGFATHDVPAKCTAWMLEPNVSGPGDPTWKP